MVLFRATKFELEVSLVSVEHSSSVQTMPRLHLGLLDSTHLVALGSPVPSARGYTEVPSPQALRRIPLLRGKHDSRHAGLQ